MSALTKRVEKLEFENIADMRKIDIFIIGVDPKNLNPIGYTCNGIEVYRQANETTDDVMNRLQALVVNNDLTGVHTFMVSVIE